MQLVPSVTPSSMAKETASPQAIINKTDMANGKTVFFSPPP
jgi:hypothetical protein